MRYLTLLFLLLFCIAAFPANLDTELHRWFEYDNKTYFDGKLPANTIVRFGSAKGDMGSTQLVDGVFVITIDSTWAPAPITQQETLLHEECHVDTWSELEEHGPRWEACMHRLYMNHAFDGLL